MNPPTGMNLRFCTGFGQFDTRKSSGDSYPGISAQEIVRMVRNPPSAPKTEAQWFIPSTYLVADGRSHTAQRERGEFWFLTLDVDENDLSLAEIDEALVDVCGEAGRLVYSSRSATTENRKWRGLLPLSGALIGADYFDTAAAFYDLLEEVSHGSLIPDRALARPGQLVYLPNRGEHYEHSVFTGPRLELTSDHPVILRREETRRMRSEAEVQAAASRKWKARQAPTENESIVAAFNSSTTIAKAFEIFGYKRAGSSNDYRSPLQTSGGYATRDYGDHWISLSASDAAQGLGQDSKTGQRFGDAFDLFVHFEHGGDFTAAVRAYASEIGKDVKSKGRAAHQQDAGMAEADRIVPDAIDLSHNTLALDLGCTRWDQDAKFVALWGKWLFWTGSHWETDELLNHMTDARAYLNRRASDLIDWAELLAEKKDEKAAEKIRAWAKSEARTLRSAHTVAAVVGLARSNSASVARADDFDAERLLLGTPGGTVDLRTGFLRPARREDMITRQTAFCPALPGTRPKRWLEFLAEIFDGDQEIIDFIQRSVGYALTGMTTEHKLLFLYGTGRNGKSVFMNALVGLWGGYARRAASGTFLNSQTERHPTDLAGLQGARLVVGSELPKGKSWDEAVIKDLTGGDRMTARYMRQDFFDFDPQLTLMIAGNNKPSFRGVDEAIRARVVLVPFTVTIPPEGRDLKLAEKLKAEGPAILRWAIEGALEWQRQGLAVPASIVAASEEYFDDEDTLGQFLADETCGDSKTFTSSSDLHFRFRQWSEKQGLAPWTMHTFVKELKSRGFKDHRRAGARGFIGLKLR